MRCALCIFLLTALVSGQQIAPPEDVIGWDFYQVVVQDHHPQFTFRTLQVIGNEADLYVRRGVPPSVSRYDARSVSKNTSNETIVLNAQTNPPLRSGTWWVGVRRPPWTSYNTSFTANAVPASHGGLGANLFDDGPGLTGTTFRVWAPYAQSVHVAGDFNGWSGALAELASEPFGMWSLDYRGVGAGANYRYSIVNGSQTLSKNDPRAREVTTSVGDSVVIDPEGYAWGTSTYGTPSWNEMVVYEMHIGAFNDTPGGAPGTFASAIQRIPYLADLGVNVIELMPVCEFAGDFSWGYNYSHPFAVEQAYGGGAGLRDFVREAHQNGIAVVLDVLYNHWGPSDLDLWRFDGWSQGPWGGIYFYQDNRAQTPWGDTKPDYGRGEVRQYIRDNAMHWLDEYRLDGLRWDSTSTIRLGPLGPLAEGWSLMQWVNDEVDAAQPWKIQIAEDMYNAPNDWITKPTGAGGAGFDSQWDALYVHPIRDAIVPPDDNGRNMWDVADAIQHDYNGDAFQRVIYTESHDEVANGRSRVPEEIWPGNAGSWYSKKRSTLGAGLTMTAPGIPMIFMGQEFLEDGYFDDADPLDWSKLQTYAGIHDLYRDLIRLRRDWWNNTSGLRGQSLNFFHVNDSDKMVAFHRWDQGGPGDDVIVVVNFRDQPWWAYDIGFPRDGDWYVRFNSDWSGYDPSFGNHPSNTINAAGPGLDGLPFRGTISIGPYSVIILSQ